MALKKFTLLLSVVIAMEFYEDVVCVDNIPSLNPGDAAPPFVLQTLLGRLVYDPGSPSSNIQPPLVFHAFTNKSGFLEALLHNSNSLIDLIANSPENTQYVFMSWDEHAFLVSKTFEEKLKDACYSYHKMRW